MAKRKKQRSQTSKPFSSLSWQRRFWEHKIRDETDFERHLDYIHYNPVKHQLVAAPCDWPYSSFHRYVDKGLYSPDWGTIQPVSFCEEWE